MKILFLTYILLMLCNFKVSAQSKTNCYSLMDMTFDSKTIMSDVATDDLLRRLAPNSKLFYSEEGLLIFDRSDFWYFLNKEQNVIVRISNLSNRWKKFLESVLPINDYDYKPLITSLKRNLQNEEKCAIFNLIEKISKVFCYQTIEEIEALLRGIESKTIDLEQLKREEQIKENEIKKKQMAKRYDSRPYRQLGKLIYYDMRFILLNDQNEVFCFTNPVGDISTIENMKKVISVYSFININILDPNANDGIVIAYDGTLLGYNDLPDPNYIIPEQELRLRGIMPTVKGEIKQTIHSSSIQQFELKSASNIELGKQYCPYNLNENIGQEKQTINVFLIDNKNAVSLNSWILIADNNCYKCGGIENRNKSFIITEKLDSPLKVDSLGINGQEMSVKLIDMINIAVDQRLSGQIDSDDISALGENGISFLNTKNTLVLLTKNYKIIFQDENAFSKDEFFAWYDLMKNENPLDLTPLYQRTAIMKLLFDSSALARDRWRKNFRQDPMAFAKKFCVIEPIN